MKAVPRLVVVEGAHGSGKTTLAQALARRLKRDGLDSKYTKEPFSQILKRPISLLASRDFRDALALAYLIAADRHLHLSILKSETRTGSMMICDRYLDSSLVYQRIDGLPLDLINRLNFFVPDPTYKIYLSVPLKVRLSRLAGKARKQSKHTFLTRSALKKEQRLYEKLIASQRRQPNRLVLDGTQPVSRNVELARSFLLSK